MQKTFTGLLPIFTVVLPSSPRQVDPDEDFAGGRRNEAKIYLVGGLIAVLVPLIGGIWACAGPGIPPSYSLPAHSCACGCAQSQISNGGSSLVASKLLDELLSRV